MNEHGHFSEEDFQRALAAGLYPRWWCCPLCGSCHKRGYFRAIGNHRCLKCGYKGSGGLMGTDDEPKPRVRGYMGGDVAGGCDVDDADRELDEGKPEMVRLRIVLKTLTAYGVEEKAISESQDLTRGHVQAAINWLQNAWKECADPNFPAPTMTMAEAALAIISELCSAIETQSPSVTNEFVENARKRARDFLESVGKLWSEARPT